MYTIGNDELSILINSAGAELNSVFCKSNGQEYLWNGDPKFWGKRSPVLFPVVGTLKNNTYLFNDRGYELGRHGFARDKIFQVSAHTASTITFTLQDDETTFDVYPFHFTFSIIYAVTEKKLSVTYRVKNTGKDVMLFSVGGHPAFKLPIDDKLDYNDYYLLFNKTENAGRWPISKDGLIEMEPSPLLDNTNKLALSKELFYRDAIVFKHLNSDEVSLKTDKDPAGFRFSFSGFPYLGIWAAKDAGFICIEPWCGIADSVSSNQQLRDKEGVIKLEPAGNFERTWMITLW